jgi:hypothetical protein
MLFTYPFASRRAQWTKISIISLAFLFLYVNWHSFQRPSKPFVPSSGVAGPPQVLPSTPEPASPVAADNDPSSGAANDTLLDKVVVMGKLSHEDTSWVATDLPDWQHAIYVVDDQNATLSTPANKAKEAMPYLTYIIDNYHNLPSTMAFIHSHRGGYPEAWHTGKQRIALRKPFFLTTAHFR